MLVGTWKRIKKKRSNGAFKFSEKHLTTQVQKRFRPCTESLWLVVENLIYNRWKLWKFANLTANWNHWQLFLSVIFLLRIQNKNIVKDFFVEVHKPTIIIIGTVGSCCFWCGEENSMIFFINASATSGFYFEELIINCCLIYVLNVNTKLFK